MVLKRLKRLVIGGAALAALALGGSATAGAATGSSNGSSSTMATPQGSGSGGSGASVTSIHAPAAALTDQSLTDHEQYVRHHARLAAQS